MTKAIQQSEEFEVSPDMLYEMYIDSKKHSKATENTAKLGRRAGAPFTAFGGQIRGKNLLIVPKKMIVQSWRSKSWKKSDTDSILTLTFSKTKKGGRVDLVHVNVPEYDLEGVIEGWKNYYWKPWRDYINAQRAYKKPTRKRPLILL